MRDTAEATMKAGLVSITFRNLTAQQAIEVARRTAEAGLRVCSYGSNDAHEARWRGASASSSKPWSSTRVKLVNPFLYAASRNR
jgi:hypothetical protein